MSKFCFVLGLVVVLAAESSCQRFIFPTYRPPPRPRQPIIRTAREVATEGSPLWLYEGDDVIRAPSTADHPVLPAVIDDVTPGNTRHARSLSSPSGGSRGSGSRSSRNDGSRSRGNDASHGTGPSNNRRNARSIYWSDVVADPVLPGDVTSGNIRHVRSLSTPGGGRGSGSSSSSRNAGSRSRGNDASHGTGPSNNRRNARSLHWPDVVTTPPFNPKPWTVQPQRVPQRGHRITRSPLFRLPNWLKLPQPKDLLKKPRRPVYYA